MLRLEAIYGFERQRSLVRPGHLGASKEYKFSPKISLSTCDDPRYNLYQTFHVYGQLLESNRD